MDRCKAISFFRRLFTKGWPFINRFVDKRFCSFYKLFRIYFIGIAKDKNLIEMITSKFDKTFFEPSGSPHPNLGSST